MDVCVTIGAADVQVGQTAAFWIFVFRSVPQTFWLNAPQRFGCLCYALRLIRPGEIDPTDLDSCIPVGASDASIERATAFCIYVWRSVPQTSWLNGPQHFGCLRHDWCLRRPGRTDPRRFLIFVFWSVPETIRLNRPQRFGSLCCGRCLRPPG